MPSNLSHSSLKSSDRRPHQMGLVAGVISGTQVVKSVEWLIDTGAEISVVTKAVGDCFDLTAVAGSASGTTGGAGILIKSGLTTKIEVLDQYGTPYPALCGDSVGVKANNAGSEIIGIDRIVDAKAVVKWDPVGSDGSLRDR